MKQLRDILHKVALVGLYGSTDISLQDLQLDSRAVHEGSVFIAVVGLQADGHAYIDKAIALGAVAVICEDLPATLHDSVTYVQVKNAHEATGVMAHNFYDEPSTRLKLVGVTGTNGKTTIATLLFNLFSELGYHCGLLSTVQNKIGTEIIPATHTTPDAIQLNALLAEMVSRGCTHAFMECSSHAIDQRRIAGLHFKGALFSNITHDHLDYHKTFDNYIKAKKRFFDDLSSDAFALSNADDKRGTVMLQNTKASRHYYGLKNIAEFKGKILENNLTGLTMLVGATEVNFGLIGTFNAYNLLAVYGAATLLGESSEEVLRVLSMIKGAEGRFDYLVSNTQIIAIVDYAHTPDALENVLATINQLRNNGGQIISVVGCGGDRDRTKRPEMAAVAASLSDRVILTSDNPRSEEPAEIIREMEAGLDSAGRKKSISIVDRKEAIKTAISLAQAGDIILVAGKGHEKYQEIKGVKNHFDDHEVVREMFSLLDK
ncbi:UDP-N-acetylmuramoylalanyl-D-glutamate--2,6-diaminopimelate ligase [Arachidicoccus rhizosphaerae]|uniref:UDP-N-acetylmuramoyl-L-alanyl-D-glutamate--2,6-diaminopimelate ligase n=1 Tax=Arachidicoccus rhizosphaerae TaxID=551991 RepID=A0A1H3Y006_9BACT|nr:UDP-N-acetylmuramoyl-L-alanyl-D-glutamate--2,6-diaminopimelate ligase [Arachidicoccus rhizosphaerae]SEA05029.1 UDP-N-acetylmuramoylalanyl-D-glutamate--2,6-diaminopimelate ligase [Arachidicoccus rhizosphaerae]